jgi:hypothetical protein
MNQIPDKNSTKLDDLSQKLYSPNTPNIVNKKVKPLSTYEDKVSHDWEVEAEVDETDTEPLPNRSKGPLFFFIIALIFALASFGFAWYFIVNKGGAAANVNITVTGPVSVAAGSEYPLEVKITNTNSFALELVDLVIDYPEGTKKSDVPDEDIGTYREGLGAIEPGQTVTRTISSVLFGESQQKQVVAARAEYRIPNSNAIFRKEKQVDVLIESGPVEFVLDTLNESIAGQETTLTLHIKSNTDAPIVNMLVKAEFPQGFSLISTQPQATSDNDTWLIKVLEPRQSQTIKIVGVFNGESDTDRFVRFTAGVADQFDNKKISNIYASSLEKVTIVKPFLSADLIFKDGFNIDAGDVVKGSIAWQNNSGGPLTDVGIEMNLSGNALNKKIIVADKGFFRSIDNKITWNKTTNPEFAKIDDGQSGIVDFEFGVFNFGDYAILTKNPEVNLDVSLSARRPTQSGVAEEIKSSVTQKIKVATQLGFNAKSAYYIGPFTNVGPLPPMPEKSTTYTIIWTLTNESNDVSGTQVTGYLPPYMSWNNKFSPTSDRVAYDEVTRKITWNPGTIPAGTGYARPSREAAFQVTLFPSTNQAGETPMLIGNISYGGKDISTNEEINMTYGGEITTRMINDPNFVTSMEKVGGE